MSPGLCPLREADDGVGIMIEGVTVGRADEAGAEGETNGAVLRVRGRRSVFVQM